LDKCIFLPRRRSIINPGVIIVAYQTIKDLDIFKVQRDRLLIPEMKRVRRKLLKYKKRERII
jgi:hypothetical protein